jgi:hypothetical protein
MKVALSQPRSGIALIMVMIMVVVFAILAGGLSYTMKVETKLARNSNWDTELEWLGRSGIELAKYFLSQSGQGGQQYDALNQKWAGGTGETNEVLANLSLTDNQLGAGRFSVRIQDSDRKFNINMAAAHPEIVMQGLILMGVDAAEGPHIVNAIADWVDRDDQTRMGSSDTESDYYMTLRPAYPAKNGPIDDITELMMIKGITPAMFYGSGSGAALTRGLPISNRFNRARDEEISYPIGLADLFTSIGARLNPNTASVNTLQLIPDVDHNLAQAIIQTRAGPNGLEGDEDDMPFRSIGEMQNVPGMTSQILQIFSRVGATRSSTFEVEVDVEIDAVKRTFYAVLRRTGNNQIVTLFMYWR